MSCLSWRSTVRALSAFSVVRAFTLVFRSVICLSCSAMCIFLASSSLCSCFICSDFCSSSLLSPSIVCCSLSVLNELVLSCCFSLAMRSRFTSMVRRMKEMLSIMSSLADFSPLPRSMFTRPSASFIWRKPSCMSLNVLRMSFSSLSFWFITPISESTVLSDFACCVFVPSLHDASSPAAMNAINAFFMI